MNAGSLFSGIGGLDYGLARAGFQHVFFCEWDEWRRRILAHHWPGVPIYADVRDVGIQPAPGAPADASRASTGEERRSDAGAVPLDLTAGGFPCQDLSVAGNRAGLAGSRSGLFHEFARIIDTFRPRWVLIENVPGLLSSNGGRDFGIVLGTLADIGYGVAWRTLDSRYFGVPQRRRRVFILATVADGDPRGAAERAGEVLAVGTRCTGHPTTRSEAREGSSEPFAVSTLQGGGGSPRGHRNDAEGAAGGQLVATAYHFRTRDNGSCFEETEVNVSKASVGGSGGAKLAIAFHATQDPISGDISPAIGVSSAIGVRRLTPTECERLQALPDGWTDHGPDSRRYSALGDAVTASVGEWIGRRLMTASRPQGEATAS